MDNLTKKKVCAVVTRYNEYIDWIKYITDRVDIIYIYNKGNNENFFRQPENIDLAKIIILKLPNVGRIDHTIAYHIINNWEMLDDTLVFLPGSILMCKWKGHYLDSIIKRIGIIDRFKGFYSPRFHKVSPKYNYTIDTYQAEGVCNRNDNPFIKSEYPDLQSWKEAIIDTRPMHYIAMRGMFIVNKENIKYVPKETYLRMLESLSVGDNIENGHFAERIWAHLFRQYSYDTTIIPEGIPEITPVTEIDEKQKSVCTLN